MAFRKLFKQLISLLTIFIDKSRPDVVYAGDLEKAIEYSILSEIPNQALLTPEKMTVMYLYLDVLVRFAPVRAEIKEFLVSLREWPVRAKLYTIRSKDYTKKVSGPVEKCNVKI